MFSVKQIRPKVYHLEFDSWREMSMTFVRYQEFYESKYDNIRDSKFTLVQQMGAYNREYLEDNDATWTYCSDWGGYNIPAEVIKQVHDLGIPDPNHYDSLMLGIYGMIMCDTFNKKAYIIGTHIDEDEKLSESMLKHEMTHAMWYTNDEYREKALAIIDSVSEDLREALIDALAKQNYPRKTALDEINAYLTTGTCGYFDLIENQDELDEMTRLLKKLHREYYDKFINEE